MTVHLGVFFVTLVLAFAGTRGAVFLALRLGWTAEANRRSSHKGKLAYGGGGPVLVAGLVVWVFAVFPLQPAQIAMLGSVAVLAIASGLDDLRGLPPRFRLATQIGVVVLCVSILPPEARILEEIPLFLERFLATFLWIWFINLFNFMDGIDGLAGVETLSVGLGAVLVLYLTGGTGDVSMLAVALAGSVAGFLPWNWHRARIMLGDLGSVPIGFLSGYILIELAVSGHLLAALILPSYFVADATLTILRRLFEGRNIAEPHREHFYQRACPVGRGHDRVVVRVALANIALIGCAVLSLYHPVWAGIGALAVNGLLLWVLGRLGLDASSAEAEG